MAQSFDMSAPESEAQIVKGIEGILAASEDEDAPVEARNEATAEATPDPTPDSDREGEEATGEPDESAETAEAEDASDTPEAEQAEAKPETEEEPEGVDIPDTLSGLADQLEVDADDLASHLRVTVKVDGKAMQVSVADAIKGYAREGDYQQKTAALADERRSFDEERQAFTTERDQNIQVLYALAQHAEHVIAGEEQTLDPKMEEDDPIEYQRRERHSRQRRDALQQLYGGISHVLQQAQQQQAQQRDAIREQHARQLAEKVPEWGADPYKAQREISELRAWARQEYGYSQAETDGLIDSRTILAFRELKQLREQKSAVPLARKKLKTIPKTKPTKPGAGRDAADARRTVANRSMGRLRKTGDYRDSAQAMIDLGLL